MQSLALNNETDLCKTSTKNRDTCWLWIRRPIPNLSDPIGINTQFTTQFTTLEDLFCLDTFGRPALISSSHMRRASFIDFVLAS